MPPYWSLGFHLCRWGYGTANHTLEVVKRMRDKGIPQVSIPRWCNGAWDYLTLRTSLPPSFPLSSLPPSLPSTLPFPFLPFPSLPFPFAGHSMEWYWLHARSPRLHVWHRLFWWPPCTRHWPSQPWPEICCHYSKWVVDWLIDWLIDWLVGWLIDQSINQLMKWLGGRYGTKNEHRKNCYPPHLQPTHRILVLVVISHEAPTHHTTRASS